MKRRLAVVAVSGVLMAPTFGLAAIAENATNTPTTTNTSAQTTTETPKTETTLAQRLEARKTALKTKLDATTKKRIETKCKPAQALVTAAQKKATTAGDNRVKIYGEISTKVDALITKLKTAGADTTELESLQTQLKTKITTFTTDAASYKQSLEDLAALDCVSDPTAFKATLETARTQRAQLAKDAADVRTQLGLISKALKTAGQTLRSSSGGVPVGQTGGN